MTVTVIHNFAPNRMTVSGEVLGSKVEFAFRDYPCRIIFPRNELVTDGTSSNTDYQYPSIQGHHYQDNQLIFADVTLLQIEIDFPESLNRSEFFLNGSQEPSSEKVLLAINLLAKGATIGGEILSILIKKTRVYKGQFWLEPSQYQMTPVGRSEIVDSDGRKLPVGYGQPLSVYLHTSDGHVLNPQDLDSYTKSLEGADLSNSPILLLADAKFYAWRASEPDPRLGLVLAAFACESKIKNFLLSNCESKQKSLVELLINSPRDFSTSVSALFDKVLESIIGISLREENRDLYKRLTKVFEDRNQFAHRNKTEFSKDVVTAHIFTIQEIFDWLDNKAAI